MSACNNCNGSCKLTGRCITMVHPYYCRNLRSENDSHKENISFFPTIGEVDEMFYDFFDVKDNGDDTEEHY